MTVTWLRKRVCSVLWQILTITDRSLAKRVIWKSVLLCWFAGNISLFHRSAKSVDVTLFSSARFSATSFVNVKCDITT